MKVNKIKNYIIVLFCVFVIGLGLIYVTTKNYSNNKVTISLNSAHTSIINLKDNFPMNDIMGKKIVYDDKNSNVQGYFEFEVENKSDVDSAYEVFVSDSKFNNTIHPNYIKLYLTDENNNPVKGFEDNVPTYYDLRVSSILPTGRKLYSGYLPAHQTKRFILRAWVGDAYKINESSNNFGMNIYVEADH